VPQNLHSTVEGAVLGAGGGAVLVVLIAVCIGWDRIRRRRWRRPLLLSAGPAKPSSWTDVPHPSLLQDAAPAEVGPPPPPPPARDAAAIEAKADLMKWLFANGMAGATVAVVKAGVASVEQLLTQSDDQVVALKLSTFHEAILRHAIERHTGRLGAPAACDWLATLPAEVEHVDSPICDVDRKRWW
jgi:hypothetical protein